MGRVAVGGLTDPTSPPVAFQITGFAYCGIHRYAERLYVVCTGIVMKFEVRVVSDGESETMDLRLDFLACLVLGLVPGWMPCKR